MIKRKRTTKLKAAMRAAQGFQGGAPLDLPSASSLGLLCAAIDRRSAQGIDLPSLGCVGTSHRQRSEPSSLRVPSLPTIYAGYRKTKKPSTPIIPSLSLTTPSPCLRGAISGLALTGRAAQSNEAMPVGESTNGRKEDNAAQIANMRALGLKTAGFSYDRQNVSHRTNNARFSSVYGVSAKTLCAVFDDLKKQTLI